MLTLACVPPAGDTGDMKERPNLVLAVVVGAIAVLVVAAAVLSGVRTPPVADPATPEGTVQLFVTAVLEGDDDAAVALLDPALGCRAPLPERGLSGVRATFAIAGTRTAGQTATVEIDVTEYRDGPFESSSHRESYRLVAADGRWLITGEPWPVYVCEK